MTLVDKDWESSGGKDQRSLHRVVLATDFSPRASRALQRVQYLPFALSAEVILVHVLPPTGLRNARQMSSLEAKAKGHLERQKDRLRRGFERLGRPHVTVRPTVLRGDPALELVKIAQDSSVDVLLIGKHGTSKVKDLLLGSTAERVIHECHVPMLIVGCAPRGFYLKPLMALASDVASRVVVDTGLRLMPERHEPIDVVNAVAVPMEEWLWGGWASAKEIVRLKALVHDRACRDLERMLAGVQCRLVMREGDPRQIVPNVAKRRSADLIVVGTHAAPSMLRFRLASVAAHIVRHAPCDVLVVPIAA